MSINQALKSPHGGGLVGVFLAGGSGCGCYSLHGVAVRWLAVELLGELRDIFGDTKWLFPARNVAWATQPWGSTAMGHAVRNAGYDWTARDLRRTWKTLAGGAGLGLEIRNRIQGHALQDVGSRHYDRHSYLEEKRAALEQWERELQAWMAEGGNVVALQRSRIRHL